MSISTLPTKLAREDSARPRWFDAHNHLHDPRLGGDFTSLIHAQRSAGLTGCVVNATCEADWPIIADLATRHPDFIHPAFGIHPWQAHTATPGWQDRLRNVLTEFPESGIGECGIDSWINTPDLTVQTPVFLDHLRIAREMERPITIHCLKAWSHLFDCFAKEPPPAHFLLHSFGGSLETARRLLPMGAYFSASGYFLHEKKHKTLDVFRALPSDRILLETDAPDMLPPASSIQHPLPGGVNHPANAASIGMELATRLGHAPDAFAIHSRDNALAWLRKHQSS